MVAQGPESMDVKSIIRMPSSGPVASVMANLLTPFAARGPRVLRAPGSRLRKTPPRSILLSHARQRAAVAGKVQAVAGLRRTPMAGLGGRPVALPQKPTGPWRARLRRQANADRSTNHPDG